MRQTHMQRLAERIDFLQWEGMGYPLSLKKVEELDELRGRYRALRNDPHHAPSI